MRASLSSFSKKDLNLAFRRAGRRAFFVQIGAMDGVTFDPLHAVVRELGWRGVLVEPLPDMFAKLKKNYADLQGLAFVNKAIAHREGRIDMARIDPADIERGIFSKGALGISSITSLAPRNALGRKRYRLAKASAEDIRRYKKILTVPCCRLQTLLAQNRVKRLDVLAVDAEGADWTIVRQLPLATFRPRVIYFEYDHLTARERMACVRHFRENSYSIRLDRVRQENLLAVRR